MIEVKQYNFSPDLERVISAKDYVLLSQVRDGVVDLDLITNNARYLNYLAKGDANLEEVALTATILQWFFSGNLPADQRIQLEGIMEKIRHESPVVRQVEQSFQSLETAVQEYFVRPDGVDFYWLPSERLKDELAKAMVDLRCHEKVKQVRKFLDDERKGQGIVVETFEDPNSDMIGFWMSTQGIAFDPEKLR